MVYATFEEAINNPERFKFENIITTKKIVPQKVMSYLYVLEDKQNKLSLKVEGNDIQIEYNENSINIATSALEKLLDIIETYQNIKDWFDDTYTIDENYFVHCWREEEVSHLFICKSKITMISMHTDFVNKIDVGKIREDFGRLQIEIYTSG